MLVTVSYVHQKKNEAIKLFLLVVHFPLSKPDAGNQRVLQLADPWQAKTRICALYL